ncbi:hypothetical protein [Streptomyces malaysiensis]|uniref:hypothetical protein n=1 Tax=Streptomyces malaysiensis TaxID=92644 RepID=UPI00114D2771|nr:hypothetical protein [Streptomyces sp. SPMA113]
MAWNEIPAKDDPNLSFQAYYARPNVLQSMLGGASREAFRQLWARAEDDDLTGLARSDLAGSIAADLIRGLGVREITEMEIKDGSWFVHSGVTRHSYVSPGIYEARILSPIGWLTSKVRSDCRLTSSASVNMSGDDDVSFVVGRIASLKSLKFDLVVAGYREAFASLTADRIFVARSASEAATDLSMMAVRAPWRSDPIIKIAGFGDDEMLRMAIYDTVIRFEDAVERHGAWRLLYDGTGTVMHEHQHQGMYRLFSQFIFGAYGISVDPNADHGSGPTDFTLRLRGAVNVIEFKKDLKKSEIRHGLEVQLPLYMASAEALRGTYIVMCHSNSRPEVEDILSQVFAENPDLPEIDCWVIDCRPRASASKAATREAT